MEFILIYMLSCLQNSPPSLFYKQGSWRKVTIDDFIPFDAQGLPLLPRSSIPGELWPILVAKAVCKMLAPYYEVRLDAPEFGEGSIVHMLTGWVPEVVTIDSQA